MINALSENIPLETLVIEVETYLKEKYQDNIPKSLEIGSGGNPQPGYIHTDAFCDVNTRPHIDVLCDARRLPFHDESFESVLMFGSFEHFGYFEVQRVVHEVRRVLKPSGTFKFDVPDFDWFIHAYLTGKDKNTDLMLDPVRDEKWIMHSLFGGQDAPGMTHQWGWSEKRLFDFLHKDNFEFKDVRLVGRQWRDPESNHLVVECLK